MKRPMIPLILALALCLLLCACGNTDACTCDCAQCTQCEKKTQNAENLSIDSNETEKNDDVIEFETPVVVAEDQYLRAELVRFYQEYRCWTENGYPNKANLATEGATFEKFVVFKFCNKSDHTLNVRLSDIYLGSDGADYFPIDGSSSIEVAAGKNVLGNFLIRTGEKETLKSMEDLYSMDGDFYIYHKGEDGVLRNGYELDFSISNGMNTGSASPNAETAPLEQASSDERVQEVIKLIDEIVLEDIVVTDAVKEAINGIYTKYNALTDEEREKVSNYETLNKAKDIYNEMWVQGLVEIEKVKLSKYNYTNELLLDIIWVNKSPKTVKYINFVVGITNSVGDYFTKNGQKFAIYQQTGPCETNYRKTNDDVWYTGLYPASSEVGNAVINKIIIEYMDGSTATITEENVRFAFPE